MSIPSGITRADILDGIRRYQHGERAKFGDSTKYDLVFEGTRYPPKAVLGLSTYRLRGHPLGPHDFGGGEETACFRILRSLSFEIVPKGPPTGWIFQGNPDEFDIEGYIKAYDEILWYVGQAHYKDAILPGQPVFFWKAKGKSGKDSGIVALGKVLTKPEPMLADEKSRPFARSGFDSSRLLRVQLKILSRRLGKDLLRKEHCKQDQILNTLSILRQAAGTNFPLSDTQVTRLLRFFEGSSDLPSEVEIHDALKRQVRDSLKLSHEDRRKRLGTAPRKPKQVTVTAQAFIRNPDVIAEALVIANGICGICLKPAPFNRASDRSPYLEVHHKIPLAQGGDDTLENAIALCPNCHRNEHHGTDPVLVAP